MKLSKNYFALREDKPLFRIHPTPALPWDPDVFWHALSLPTKRPRNAGGNIIRRKTDTFQK